jgi:hypothetical protein
MSLCLQAALAGRQQQLLHLLGFHPVCGRNTCDVLCFFTPTALILHTPARCQQRFQAVCHNVRGSFKWLLAWVFGMPIVAKKKWIADAITL